MEVINKYLPFLEIFSLTACVVFVWQSVNPEKVDDKVKNAEKAAHVIEVVILYTRMLLVLCKESIEFKKLSKFTNK